MTRRTTVPGFTLIELLVVIAILGVLIGLIVPAVQQIRSRADRVSCSNNLRQLGLALHAYHDTYHAFPPGLSSPTADSSFPFLSWNARVLPFLEQANLWRDVQAAYALDRNFLNVPPHAHRSTVVPVFSCPSDPRASSPSTKLAMPIAFTSYLGVCGTDCPSGDGVLFLDSRVRIADIRDGTSNTLLLGERPPSADERFGWWYAGWGQAQDGSAEMVLGVTERNVSDPRCWSGPYAFGPGRFDNQCDCYHFWSPHVGGGSFLFADGAVRFLMYSIQPAMPALATRQGGEVIAADY